ncbi:MAG: DUF3021 domain-containing protein [Clostridiales bacterium]|nr:DUF3021 domain-containing protein [Clostridiales bacterium]MDO4350171.1 DUF3021 domain-containing protein [Eubacteriales bacterium]MDY4008319.1 DUF3021 domain-containing protein [Candidatus Limiplasma sp.]
MNHHAKQALRRALLGAPLGIAIGHVITLCISYIVGGGAFFPCVPAFAAQLGELNAAALQAALTALTGAGYAAASVIWEIDRWSLLKQTLLYLAAAAASLLPTAYVCHWMEHSLMGALAYAAVFLGIFVFIWLAQYLALRKKIAKMNAAMGKK